MQNRKDSHGRVLHKCEYEIVKKNKGGQDVSYYIFKYKDTAGKNASLSAPDLVKLREKEKALQKDFFFGLRTGREKEKTVSEMCDIYLETKINLKETTASNYRYMTDKFIKCSRIGGMKIADVKKSDIQKYYGDLLKEGMAANTLETIHTILHPVFQRAIDDGYIRINPTQNILSELKKSDIWVKKKKEALTVDEQETFFDYLRDNPVYSHWMPLFTFMFGTGCRVGETIGLTWDNVNLQSGYISVNRNLVYCRGYGQSDGMKWVVNTPKTGSGRRDIDMMDDVRDALLSLKKERFRKPLPPVNIDGVDYNFVFRNRYGEPFIPSEINRAIKRIVRDYNKGETERAKQRGTNARLLPDFSCHIIRHTFCTRLSENTNNVNAIKAIMGHADIQTTYNIYADVTKQARRETLEEMNGKIKIS